ncbi:MAG TPA: peptidase [Nevskia sp.]|nr:peptidase [Nevskia sp.]
MTYCLAIKVDEGLVFGSDTRTSAAVDDVRTYNKSYAFEYPGERVLVMLSAGNLATTQSLVHRLHHDVETGAPLNLRNARNLFAAAEYVGATSVGIAQASAQLSQSTADFRVSLILGGQIAGQEPEIYLIYMEGNCISSSVETPFLQIGETKYGKPILDRAIHARLGLNDAARCAMVSLDATVKSNLSVGPPLDLAFLPRDTLKLTHLRLDLDSPYYRAAKEAWNQAQIAALQALPRFPWEPRN